MKCIKKFAAVAVVLLVTASSSFAEWDKFAVIEAGSAEAKFGFYDEGMGPWLGVRYGLMENLEIFSTVGTDFSDYTVGGRYQVMDMLAVFLDLDVPTAAYDGYQTLGLSLGGNFMTDFTETISLGSGVKLGIGLEDDAVINLGVGVEVDFMLSEKVGLWVGVDLALENMTADGWEFDAARDITPGLGLFFSADNLTVGTLIGIKLNHTDGLKDDNITPKDAVALTGGVEFAIKF